MNPNRRTVAHGDREKKELLEKDLHNELRWLFVGAVTWAASGNSSEDKDPLSMIASLTHARALYEFFYTRATRPDDARALQFCSAWNPSKTTLY